MVPMVDLRAAWAEIADEVEPIVLDRLRSGDYLGHDAIAAFEAEFAAYVGGGVHAVACSSGTDAVELMTRCTTREGAIVDVQERTFVATVAGVERAGRKVQRDALNQRWYWCSPDSRPAEHADAAILTHLYGSTAGAAERAERWRERGVTVLEDASQAHGSADAGKIGDAAAFSLYPSKNLGGVTQGGVVTFRDPVAAAHARRVREHGYDRVSDRHFERGFNMRLPALNADVLRAKLRRLDGWVARRRAIAATYCAELANVPKLLLPGLEPNHAWHIYSVRVPRDRDGVIAKMRERGVSAAVHYRRDAFGVEHEWTRENVSLPIFPQMSDSQVAQVIDAVRVSV
jgi:dTDP-4-amino-4,6-dideoxygalactose transaminase